MSKVDQEFSKIYIKIVPEIIKSKYNNEVS